MVHAWWLMTVMTAATPCKSGLWDPEVVRTASQQGETQVLQVRKSQLAPASNRWSSEALVPTGIPQTSLVRGDGCVISDDEALELVTIPALKRHVAEHLGKGQRRWRVTLGALAAGVFGMPAVLFAVGAAVGAGVGLVQFARAGTPLAPVQGALVGAFLLGGLGVVLGVVWMVGAMVLAPLVFKDTQRGPALEEIAAHHNEALANPGVNQLQAPPDVAPLPQVETPKTETAPPATPAPTTETGVTGVVG